MWGWSFQLWVCLVGVAMCVTHPLEAASDHPEPGEYVNSFIMKVHDNVDIELVAREHGFEIEEKLPGLDIYHLVHSDVATRSKRADETFVSRMREDPRIKLFEQQQILSREKRTHQIIHDKQLEFPIPDIKDNSKFHRGQFDTRGNGPQKFNDQFYRDQWYLHELNEEGRPSDIHLNVVRAWDMGYTGEGVVVSILDDGVDHDHPDLKRNYDPKASADLNDKFDKENDPEPDKTSPGNSHGTRCAGEIAGEAGNGICGVGVAFNAKIGGIRILDGAVTDSLEAKALMMGRDHIDIKSASWGPHDDGRTMEGPKKACKEAMQKAVQTGRNGKGTIFVWASGNGGHQGDNCGADGYVSGTESISVQSMTTKGERPFFGEICTSTMVSVPTGGGKTQEDELNSVYKIKVVTTDINGGCVENFEGTSSAAPLAAGCLALVLQANPDLTWRDVQHIVANGARIPGTDTMWTINGAGFHVNPQFGFGMMDCTQMVGLAQKWVNKPKQHVCETDTNKVDVEIANSGCHKFQFHFDGCHGDKDSSVTHIEHVELHIKLQPVRRGNVQIIITSPAGTRSEVLRPRVNDKSDEEIDFTFMTVHCWEESPVGHWTLEVCDQPPPGEGEEEGEGSRDKPAAYFESWAMRVSGYHDNKPDDRPGRAVPLSEDTMEKLIKDEFQESRSMSLKRAQVNNIDDDANADADADGDDNEDEFVGAVDSLFTTFRDTYGTRSLEYYLQTFLDEDTDGNKKAEAHKHENEADKRELEALDLKREMLDVLRELFHTKTETGESYLEVYANRKERQLEKRKLDELMAEVNEMLKQEEDLK